MKAIAYFRKSRVVNYPDSNGKPMAETDEHVKEIIALLVVLQRFFRENSNVYVAGNNFIYYEEGNPKARVSPDTYVVFGVDNKSRRSYRTWQENGAVPSVVFEVTSRKTKKQDLVQKKELYARLGIKEYYLYDPYAEYLKESLQGFRLIKGQYVAMERDSKGWLFSDALKLSMFINEKKRLRFFDPATNKVLLRSNEVDDELLKRDDEIARLKAELARVKKS